LSEFDAATYWEERLGADYSLGGVGYRGLGEPYNRWAYRVRRHVILRRLRALALPSGAQVLDVGSGTGFMIETWREAGADTIDGCDITDIAVDRLRRRFPRSSFTKLDIGLEPLPEADRYDAVSANDVMFHIVDDAAYARAVANVVAALKPGGYFVFTDFFRRDATLRGRHWVGRSLHDTVAVMESAGLDVVDRRPVFVLMNGPAETLGVLRGWWWVLSRALKVAPWAGGVVGALLYWPEVALCSAVRAGPTTELMVCRRPDHRSTPR